jgi:phage shock protein E
MNRMWTEYSALAIALVAGVALSGCSPAENRPAAEAATGEPAVAPPAAESAYTDLAPAELAALLESGDYLLVNVHIPYEGDLPGTDLQVPFDQVESHLAELEPAREGGLVLYCRSGRMSRIAADELAARGFRNMLHLDGGMIAWEAAGLPLVHENGSR